MLNIIWVALYITIGFLLEFLVKRFVISKYVSEPDFDGSSMGNYDKFIAGIAQLLPSVVGLILFFGAAYFAFMAFIWTNSAFVQLFFMATLIAITCIRSISILAQVVFSPGSEEFRIIPMQNRTAKLGYRLIVWTFGYIVVALMFTVVARRLGATVETVRLLQLFSATLLLAVTAGAVIIYR